MWERAIDKIARLSCGAVDLVAFREEASEVIGGVVPHYWTPCWYTLAEGLSTLHDATGGDPSASPRWHRNLRLGGDQELIARLRDRSGQVWAMVGLYREPGRPLFDAAEKRSLLAGQASDPEEANAPAVLIVTGAHRAPALEEHLREGRCAQPSRLGRPMRQEVMHTGSRG